MVKKKTSAQLKGDVFLLTSGEQSFAAAQIDLLIAIGNCGSISRAAKQVGISYKTAWDRIDAMNNMASQPLVVRAAGGSRGGGTSLTAFGRQIIDGFQALQEEHQHFIKRLGKRLHAFSDLANFMKSETLQTSARNQFRGKVTAVSPGAVNAEVVMDIGTRQSIVAIITRDSVDSLGLKKGRPVIALVKASSVIISPDENIATSARNKLTGTISRIVPGVVNTDITIDLRAGKSVAAIITNASAKELKLREGQTACALFKASSVLLMKDE